MSGNEKHSNTPLADRFKGERARPISPAGMYTTEPPLTTPTVVSQIVGQPSLTGWEWRAHCVQIAKNYHAYFGTNAGLATQTPKTVLAALYESREKQLILSVTSFEQQPILSLVEAEVFVLASRLPVELRTAVTDRFSALIEALRDDEETVVLDMGSLRLAFSFLERSKPTVAPSFGIVERGNLYLQWFNDVDSVIGVVFKPDGRAIWSASQEEQGNWLARTAEAGERSAEQLIEFLPVVAPWIYKDFHQDEFRRRATG